MRTAAGFLTALATAAVALGPPAPACAQGRAEGTLSFQWPGDAEPTLYRYEIGPDSVGRGVTIYEGQETGARSLTLPPLILQTLAHRLERHTPQEGGGTPAFAEVALERGELLLAFERRLSIALLALAAALVAALTLALVVRRERRRRAVLVEARRREVESREAERLQLAREIHDGPVQLLHLARLNLAAQGAGGGGDPAGEVEEAVRELRAIAEGLRPPALGPFGLAPALEDLALRFREQHPGIAVDVRLDDEGGRLGEGARLALFRIAQEALTNAATHAAPTRVALRFATSASGVELSVEDDGRGAALPVDPRVLGRAGHYGLLGMHERAELLGGELDVRSQPGIGTRIRLRAPWRALAPAPPDGRVRSGGAHDPSSLSPPLAPGPAS